MIARVEKTVDCRDDSDQPTPCETSLFGRLLGEVEEEHARVVSNQHS